MSDKFAWEPTPDYVEHANVTRLMRAHGIDTIDEMRRRSVEDVEWYWDAVVKDLGLDFTTPYSKVLDTSNGVPWATWFTDGRVNITWNCVDRWAHDKAVAERTAVIGESETGEVRELTYKQLHKDVDRVAAGLLEMGVGPGDAVGVFMAMRPEAVVAAYAIAKIGAIYMPIFSGFAPSAVAARLQRLQGQGPLHHRRHLAPRQAGADEASCRRGGGGGAVDRARGDAREPRRGRADEGRPRRDLGGVHRAV